MPLPVDDLWQVLSEFGNVLLVGDECVVHLLDKVAERSRSPFIAMQKQVVSASLNDRFYFSMLSVTSPILQ